MGLAEIEAAQGLGDGYQDQVSELGLHRPIPSEWWTERSDRAAVYQIHQGMVGAPAQRRACGGSGMGGVRPEHLGAQ